MLSRRLIMAANYVQMAMVSSKSCSATEAFDAAKSPDLKDCLLGDCELLDNCFDKEKGKEPTPADARRGQFADHDYESFGAKTADNGYSASYFGEKRKEDPFLDLVSRKTSA